MTSFFKITFAYVSVSPSQFLKNLATHPSLGKQMTLAIAVSRGDYLWWRNFPGIDTLVMAEQEMLVRERRLYVLRELCFISHVVFRLKGSPWALHWESDFEDKIWTSSTKWVASPHPSPHMCQRWIEQYLVTVKRLEKKSISFFIKISWK